MDRKAVAILAFLCAAPVSATDYHYCISSERRPANMVIHSGPVDFGKEWYRTRAAQDFCSANGASSCSASDFSANCANLAEETITYHTADGDQLGALVSGNPLVMGQAAVEVATGVPIHAASEAGKGVGKAANKVCKWLNPHC